MERCNTGIERMLDMNNKSRKDKINQEIEKKVDIFYKYGVEKSINTGYVSLYYLGELLEKLCIKYL